MDNTHCSYCSQVINGNKYDFDHLHGNELFFHKKCYKQILSEYGTDRRRVKCQWCGEKEMGLQKSEMKVIEGKPNKYYHIDCYDKYEQDRKYQERENTRRDKLYETIADVHNIDIGDIPDNFFFKVEDVRNGTDRFRKGGAKEQKKKGTPYQVIKKAYEMSRKDIKWAKGNKNFDNTLNECNYGLAVAKSKFTKAKRKLREEMQHQKRNKAKTNINSELDETYRNVQYKKKNRKDDISKFL